MWNNIEANTSYCGDNQTDETRRIESNILYFVQKLPTQWINLHH